MTVEHIIAAATTGTPANNTVRQRLQVIRSFLTWARRQGINTHDLADDPALTRLRRSHPATYGKAQGKRPPRHLNPEEKDRLIASCQDDTDVGRRDELALRLGFLGMRDAEIRHLRIGQIQIAATRITWTGKGNRPREASCGPAFLACLQRYLAVYDSPTAEKVLICTRRRGQASQRIRWGTGLPSNGLYRIVTRRATDVKLGHVAPHDLRRSAAGILHNAKTKDGGHLYDLGTFRRYWVTPTPPPRPATSTQWTPPFTTGQRRPWTDGRSASLD